MNYHSETPTAPTQERGDVTPGFVGPSDHLVHHWRQDLLVYPMLPALHTSSHTVQCPPALAHSVK